MVSLYKRWWRIWRESFPSTKYFQIHVNQFWSFSRYFLTQHSQPWHSTRTNLEDGFIWVYLGLSGFIWVFMDYLRDYIYKYILRYLYCYWATVEFLIWFSIIVSVWVFHLWFIPLIAMHAIHQLFFMTCLSVLALLFLVILTYCIAGVPLQFSKKAKWS